MKKNDDWKSKLKKYLNRNLVSTLLILALAVFYILKTGGIAGGFKEKKSVYVPYSKFITMVEKNQVDYIFLPEKSSDSVQFLPTYDYFVKKGIIVTDQYVKLKDFLDATNKTSIEKSMIPASGNLKYITENPGSDTFKSDLLLGSKARVFSLDTGNSFLMILLYVLQMVLPFVMILAFFQIMQKRFEPSDNEITTDIPDTKFTNVAGYETLKEDCKFILDFLKNPKDYEKIGARLPNGILFYGPPGTGKTLMARAIAGEASVPFYKVNGSDFVELYVGMGARRVRKLYKTARENSPCIVFIDEIDSIGGARGNLRGSSEDDKTLTALLNELDGFSAKSGIITIAATNRLKDLDPALIRPGRFDRHVAVPLPDREERLDILKLYADGKKISSDVSINALADRTIDFSPSELENLLNESAIKAVTKGRDKVIQEDIDDSFLKIIIKGDKKEDKSQTEKEKRIIAYHEAGHAIVHHVIGKPVLEVSVIGTTSGAGGYTLSQPKEGLKSRLDMRNEIKGLYGGRAAETLIAKDKDDVTVGAVSDIQQATKIISSYIKTYGLNGSLINLEEFGVTRPNDEMINQANALADELFGQTLQILEKNRAKLDKLASILLEKKLIDSDKFLEIMKEEEAKQEIAVKEPEAFLPAELHGKEDKPKNSPLDKLKDTLSEKADALKEKDNLLKH